ncbi:hypothetical protein [Pseudomonas sp. L1(2025)]|uniref:hypothetical protein n=1 Tax=Pseudomonas sp. L1(2025) TaxID=3449429 RepID=UPI003F6912D9
MSVKNSSSTNAQKAQFKGTIGKHSFETTTAQVEQTDNSIALTAIHRDDRDSSEELYIKFPKAITDDEPKLLHGSKTETVWVQFKRAENPEAYQYLEGTLTLKKISDHPFAVNGSVYATTRDPQLKLDVEFELTV